MRAGVQLGVWAVAAAVLGACEPLGPGADTSPTAPGGATETPTPYIAPVLPPEIDFRIVPAEVMVPMGETVKLTATNFGVAIPWSRVEVAMEPDGPAYGSFERQDGLYRTPPDGIPTPADVTLTATWTDDWDRVHVAQSVIHLVGWQWRAVGGPGPGCDDCPSQTWLDAAGFLRVYRHGRGVWRVVEVEAIIPELAPPGAPGSGDPCETPPLDPMEQTPPGGPVEGTPSPLQPLTPTPAPTPTPTPAPTPAPTAPPTSTPTAPPPTQDGATATPPPTPTQVPDLYDGLTAHPASGIWARVGGGLPAELTDVRVFPVPGDPDGLMAIAEGRLWRSADGGDTWVEQACPGKPVTLAFFPDSPVDLLVPAKVEDRYIMARSADGGQTWRNWISDIQEPIIQLAVVPRLTTRVIAATATALYVSADGGSTFTPVRQDLGGIDTLSAHLLGVAWALVEEEGVHALLRSDTAGGDWETYNGIPGCEPVSVSVDPSNPFSMWVGCLGGILLTSYDGGQNFQTAPSQPADGLPEDARPYVFAGQIAFVRMEVGGDDLFYAFQDQQWVAFSGGPGPDLTAVRAGMAARPDLSSGSVEWSPFPALAAANTRGWLEFTTSPQSRYWISRQGPLLSREDVLVDLAFDGELRALGVTADGRLVSGRGLEEPWAEEILPQAAHLSQVDLGAGEDPAWYAWGEGDAGPLLFRRTDDTPWEALPAPAADTLRADTRAPGHLYAFEGGALATSADQGQSWGSAAAPDLGDRAALAIKPDKGELLLGADYGLYTSTDQGQSFKGLGWTEGAVEAMCKLHPRTAETASPDAEEGTGGYMAAAAGPGLGVRLEGAGRFQEVPGMPWRNPDGSKRIIRQLEAWGAYPGAAFAVVDGVGLVLVLPAPAKNLPEPGGESSSDGGGELPAEEPCP